MTQEEKQLLLRDLCARLPYGVKINHIIYNWEGTCINFNRKLESFAIEKDNGLCYDVPVEEARPYLRPMSSMTSDEKMEWFQMRQNHCNMSGFNELQERADFTSESLDWLNKKGFDYRDLIPMGLALEAPEDIYKTR